MAELDQNETKTILEQAKAQINAAKSGNAPGNATGSAPAAPAPKSAPAGATNAPAPKAESAPAPKPANNTVTVKATEAIKPLVSGAIFDKTAEKLKVSNNAAKGIIGGIVGAILVIIIIIILMLTVFSGYAVSGDVKAISLYPTKTTADIDAGNVTTASSFKVSDPIIAKFDLAPAAGSEVKTYLYEVTRTDQNDDQGNPVVVRKGSLNVSPDENGAEVSRYISISSSAKTALEPGGYQFTLTDGDQQVGKDRFTVVND